MRKAHLLLATFGTSLDSRISQMRRVHVHHGIPAAQVASTKAQIRYSLSVRRLERKAEVDLGWRNQSFYDNWRGYWKKSTRVEFVLAKVGSIPRLATNCGNV